jgi:hypothetical protein
LTLSLRVGLFHQSCIRADLSGDESSVVLGIASAHCVQRLRYVVPFALIR